MLVTVQQSPGTLKDGHSHVLDFSWELRSTSRIAVLSWLWRVGRRQMVEGTWGRRYFPIFLLEIRPSCPKIHIFLWKRISSPGWTWSSYVAEGDLLNSASTSPTAGLQVITTMTEFFESLKIIYLCTCISLSSFPLPPQSVCVRIPPPPPPHLCVALSVACMKVRGQVARVSFLLPPIWTQVIRHSSPFTGQDNSLPSYFVPCFEIDLMSPGWPCTWLYNQSILNLNFWPSYL